MTELVSRSSALLLALREAVLSLALGPRAASSEVVWPVMQCLLSTCRPGGRRSRRGRKGRCRTGQARV